MSEYFIPVKKFNNLRHFREFKGYSQKFIAYKLGISQSALSKIENGLTHISDEVIAQLSKILEVPKEKLYSNKELMLDENFEAEKEMLLPVLNNTNDNKALWQQVSDNKKLLHQIKSNQNQLQKKLNTILTSLANKK